MTTVSTAQSASKNGKRSRRKGSSGESEARKAWKERGWATVPWRGGLDGPDFIAVGNDSFEPGSVAPITRPTISVEVTRDSSRFSPLKAWHNLEKAAKGPGIPVSRIRADRKKPIVQMYEEDFFKLVAR